MGQMAVWLCIRHRRFSRGCGGRGGFLCWALPTARTRRRPTIGSAEQEAKRIIGDAIKSAEARKKEIVLEGKDELHRLRDESEKGAERPAQGDPASGAAHPPKGGEPGEKAGERLERKEKQIDQKNKKAEERLQEAEAREEKPV